jgi:uncharacterized protein YjbI with pentapeptide repeats
VVSTDANLNRRSLLPKQYGVPGERWLLRKRQLEALYNWNVASRRPPYQGVTLRSRRELLWILWKRGWSGWTLDDARGRLVQMRAAVWRLRHLRGHVPPADLRGVRFDDVDLSSLDLSQALLRWADFARCSYPLRKTKLCDADLRGARFTDRFRQVDLSRAVLIDMSRAHELHRQLQQARNPADPSIPHSPSIVVRTRNELLWLLRHTDLAQLDLSQADLFDADLSPSDIQIIAPTIIPPERARELRDAISRSQSPDRPPLVDVTLRTRQELLWVKAELGVRPDLSRTGGARLDLRGAVLSDGQFIGADLRRADLREAKLTRADITEANLSHADLEAADLSGVVAQGTNMYRARPRRAILTDADLSGADLFEADLQEARLEDASLTGANLSVADLRGARCRGAIMRSADLRRATVDVATEWLDIAIDSHTRLGDIVWHGRMFLAFDWSKARRLGDEDEAHLVVPDRRRVGRLDASRVLRTYRDIARVQSVGARPAGAGAGRCGVAVLPTGATFPAPSCAARREDRRLARLNCVQRGGRIWRATLAHGVVVRGGGAVVRGKLLHRHQLRWVDVARVGNRNGLPAPKMVRGAGAQRQQFPWPWVLPAVAQPRRPDRRHGRHRGDRGPAHRDRAHRHGHAPLLLAVRRVRRCCPLARPIMPLFGSSNTSYRTCSGPRSPPTQP